MSKVGAALLIVIAVMTSGCFKKELSPDERALIESLRRELNSAQADLSSAKAKDDALTGGMLKALIGVRIEILGANVSLLQQRINAVEAGAPIKQITQVVTPDLELAKELEGEISVAHDDLARSRTDAAGSGGLVGAMKAMSVATKEQTLAMLEQRYLSAKYGIVLPSPALPAKEAPEAKEAEKVVATPAPELPAGNGPFGLQAGLSKDVIEKMTGRQLTLADEAQSLYELESPPKPNDAFHEYGIVISPTVGLCQIRAVSKTIRTNDYGTQLKSEFNSLKESLATVYGEPKVFDALLPGSIWNESRDWMTGLFKKDRSLSADWRSTQSSPLKSDVQSIMLMTLAEGRDKGYLALVYSFQNQDTCTAEQKQRSTGSL
ncbi:hypothetical protein AL527_09705 [Pseudomonas fulva]|uniref:hypothetical protein n=1 Tax=Pseudomonas fulva TaxID=47880 RepID=UPI000CE98138|nr:hypothetical protein [Pseudomonas fulva]AVF55417.1 hypothetical protein AL527_09705 [Pseudomonas fulva]